MLGPRRSSLFRMAPRAAWDEPDFVSFRLMAGTVLAYPKRSWQGLHLRRRLLVEQGVAVPDELGEAGHAAPDDVLDAAAAAWSAYRVARGTAVPYPDPPQAGVAIWA